MINLRAILKKYQDSERGLPTFIECTEIASYIDDLETAVKEITLVLGSIRDKFERDCT